MSQTGRRRTALLAAVTVVAGMAGIGLSAAPARAATTPTPGDVFVSGANGTVTEVPSGGTATTVASGLSRPQGVALDAAENVYVVEGNQVDRIATNGTRTTLPFTGLSAPGGVAVDAAGDVFVTDYGNARVLELPAGSTTQVLVPADVFTPYGIAVDALGDLYVSDVNRNQIVEEPAGGGAQVVVATQLSSPTGIAVDTAGDLFVTTVDQDARLLKLTPTAGGAFSRTVIGTNFLAPDGVALDAAGNVFVADAGDPFTAGSSKVWKVNAAYTSQSVVAAGSTQPLGIAVYAPAPGQGADTPPTGAEVGAPYPAYTYHGVTPTGEPAARFLIARGALPPGLTLDPATGVLSGTPTAEGDYTFTEVVANAATGTRAAPATIGVRPVPTTGDVFIADTADQRVIELPADGHAPITIATNVVARAVAVDPQGNVLATDENDATLVEYPRDGSPAFVVADDLINPGGVSVDAAGDIFIADTDSAQVVEISHGVRMTVSVTGLRAPTDAVADAAGNVYVADDSTNQLTEVLAHNGGQAVIAHNLAGPTGVAVTTAGKVYVVAEGGASDDGSLLSLPAGGGQAPQVVLNRLSQPHGIALDATGHVLFTESGADKVQSYSPADRSAVSLTTGLRNPLAVAAYAPAPTFTAQTPPGYGRVGVPYGYAYAVTTPPGAPAPTYQVVAGSLPPGVTLSPTTGALSGTPSAPGTYTFTIEVDNAADGTQSVPATIAVRAATAAGDIFVADTGNARIVELPVGGGAQQMVGTGLGDPLGVDVDDAENVFVGDFTADKAVEVPADGSAQTSTGTGLSGPAGVTTDAAGNIYIADTQNNRVVEEHADGGGQTVVASGLKLPEDVAVDRVGDVFIADALNNRIVEVPAGGTLTTVADGGDGVTGPSALALDTAGDVFVAEMNSGRVLEIHAGTGAVTTFALNPRPGGVALTAAGDVVVPDYNAGVVDVYAPDGTLRTVVGVGLSDPSAVAVYAPAPVFTASTPPATGAAGSPYTGYTYAATAAAGEPAPTFRIATGALPPGLLLNATTGKLTGTPTTAGDYTFTAEADNVAHGSLAAPATIRVRTAPVAGDVFFDELLANAVTELPAGGGAAVRVIGSPVTVIGTAVDGAGDVFTIAQATGQVAEVTADGHFRTFASGQAAPTSVAADAAGDLFVTSVFGTSLTKVPAGGGTPVVLLSGLSGSEGVAVDSAGNVFASDTGHDKVLELPAGGGAAVQVGTGLKTPFGLATDAAGDLFIADAGNNEVVQLLASGVQSTVGSGLKSPSGLTVDAFGDVFVADGGNNRIVEIAAGGVQSDVATGIPGGVHPDQIAAYAPPPTFTAAAPVAGTAGVAYAYAFAAARPANEPSPGYRVVAGSLPPGLAIDGATGRLTGTPTKAGVYAFTVEAQNAATGTLAPVSLTVVKGAAASLVLTPGTATTSAGTPVSYRAEGFDSEGEDLGDVTAATRFTLTGGSCSGAACTPARATAPGSTDTVTGTDGAATGTAKLTVTTGPIDHLVLSPGNAATVAGAGVAYRAESFDAAGDDLGDATAATTFTIAGGSCAANVCTTTRPTAAGATVTVTGTDGGRTGTAFETVGPAALDHITLALTGVSVGGKPVVATVSGFDAHGNSRGDVTAASTLAITPDGSCAGTLCTPRTGGQHTVTARDGAATASVTFTPGYPVPVLQKAVLHVTDSQGTIAFTVDPAGARPVTVTVTAAAKGQKTRTATITVAPAVAGGTVSGAITATQLADGNSYAFTITVGSAGGKVVAGVGKGTPTRVPGLTLVAAHDHVTKGTVVVLTGLLLNGKNPVANRVVTLTGTTNGHTKTLSTTRTDRHGVFVFHVRPTSATSYTATAVFGAATNPTIARNTPTRISIVRAE